jgi:hypothetical protein
VSLSERFERLGIAIPAGVFLWSAWDLPPVHPLYASHRSFAGIRRA